MGNLERSTILNGTTTLAAAEQDGIYRSLQPVETMTEVVFSNLAVNTTKRFRLSSLLKTDYRVLGLAHDVVGDDTDSIPNSNQAPSAPSVTLFFKTFRNGKGNFLLRQEVSNTEGAFLNFFLLQTEEIEIRSSVALSSLTFKCVPVIVEPAIIFS
jgi:hypothetical protein